MSTLSVHPFESVVGTLEVSYLALSAILLLRGVPTGVVYTGNNHNVPTTDSNGQVDAAITEQL